MRGSENREYRSLSCVPVNQFIDINNEVLLSLVFQVLSVWNVRLDLDFGEGFGGGWECALGAM